MYACSVVQSCLTLCDPMDCTRPGSSVHGISQARILEWVAILFSRGSSQPSDWTHVSWVSCIGRQILCHWDTGEAFLISLLITNTILVVQALSSSRGMWKKIIKKSWQRLLFSFTSCFLLCIIYWKDYKIYINFNDLI